MSRQGDRVDALQDFAGILDCLAPRVTVLDREYRIAWANKAAAASAGMPRHEILGSSCFLVFHRREKRCEFCPVCDAMEAGEPRAGELTTPDGRTWLIQGYPLFDEGGTLRGAAEVAIETTDLVRATKAQKSSEQRMKAIFDAALDGILIADAETKRFHMANPAICRMLGYEPAELLRLSVHDIHPPPRVDQVLNVFERQFRSEMQLGRDLPVLRKDGTVFFADIKSSPMELDGRAMLLGVFHDVTERREAESAIRGRDDILEAVGFAAERWMRVGSWVECLDEVLARLGRATGVERLCLVEVDASDESALRTVLHHVWHAQPEPPGGQSADDGAEGLEGLQAWRSALARGELVEVHASTCSPEERAALARRGARSRLTVPVFVDDVWWGVIGLDRCAGERAWSVPERDALRTAAGLLGAAVQRGREEQERSSMQMQLLHAQKMEAIGTLAGGVSHDFNNLMTVVRGYVDLARRRLKEGDPLAPLMDRISNAATRAAELTRQLLLFTRREPTTRNPVDLNDVVKGMGEMLHRLLPESIQVCSTLHDGPLVVSGDRGNLEQVVVNLAVNGRDAMPDGGELRLSTTLVGIQPGSDQTASKGRVGLFARLTVADNGIGMEPAVVQRAFEPFYTTKAPGHGTGLGLSTVYGIVSAHDGWLEVCSTPGRGSAIHVFLPVTKQALEEESATPAIPQNVAGGGERVLVVEDEVSVRDFVANALRLAGYAVVEAESCTAAQQAFEEATAPFDLVLSDVVLPDGNGVQLIDSLKARSPDVSVILTSGYLAVGKGDVANVPGDMPFLQKPYTLHDLLLLVRETLRRRAFTTRR